MEQRLVQVLTGGLEGVSLLQPVPVVQELLLLVLLQVLLLVD